MATPIFNVKKNTPLPPEENTLLLEKNELPEFPACEEKLMGAYPWIGAISIMREVGNKASQIYLRKRIKQFATENPDVVQEQDLIYEWDKSTSKWYPLAGKVNDWAVEISKLSKFVEWVLLRARKTREEKLRMFTHFNLTVAETEQLTVKGAIENEFLDVLNQCIPFKMEYQYRIGKYRLDAFIPRLRLAIQIDENGHTGYDSSDEKEYDEVVRDHQIVCIRFHPKKQNVYELVRQVWQRTLSPDFATFREKYCLT
jgi:very-short-patch-repair endonuclease